MCKIIDLNEGRKRKKGRKRETKRKNQKRDYFLKKACAEREGEKRVDEQRENKEKRRKILKTV